MKKFSLLSLIMILMLSCLLFAACGTSDETPGETGETGETGESSTEGQTADTDRMVKIAYIAIADSMEPAGYLGIAEQICYSQVYDALLTRDANYEIVPGTAEAWTISEDGLVYTFTLNPNAAFSNGDPVTPEDVKFSIETFKASGAHGWIYEEVQEVNVIDDKTVEVILSSPKPTLLSSLASQNHFCILSKAAYEEFGDSYGSSVETTVGSGAYELVAWEPDVKMTFKAREDYFRGEAAIKNVENYQITDTNAAIVALQSGDLDIYFNPITGSAYETLQNADNVVLGEYESAKFECIHFYYPDGIFSDVRMRQAVAYAVKKEDALTIGVDGLGWTIRYPGDNPVFTANPDVDPTPSYEYDLEKAKALVEECGMTGAEVVIKSYNTDPYVPLSTWLQSVLSSIGLNATVEPMERASWLAACNAQEIDILILSWNGTAYDMDESFGALFYSGNVGTNGNYGFYINEEADELVLAARAATDTEERAAIYAELVNKMAEEVPFVPLYGVNSVIPRNAEIGVDNLRSYNMYDYYWAE